jgi:hypothetical protein
MNGESSRTDQSITTKALSVLLHLDTHASGVGVTEAVGEEGDDGVSEGSGTERRDARGAGTSLRGAGPGNKLAEGCKAPSRTGGTSDLVFGPFS